MGQGNGKVEELMQGFEDASPGLTEIITALRELVKATAPDLEEAVKYGGVVYLRDGELLGGIFLRKAFVTMEFSFGNRLQDEAKLLEGTGKLRRNLKFQDLQDIETKRAEYFIEQAYT